MIQITSAFDPILNEFGGLKQGQNATSGFKKLFEGVLAGNNSIADNKTRTSVESSQLLDIPSKGHELVDWLKKYMQSKLGDLDSVEADSSALSWFRDFLIHAGFDKDKIDNIINDLKEGGKRGNISVKDLFARISTLDIEETDAGDMIPISMLPFLHSILTSAGLDDATVESVLADAKDDGKGISLSRLIAGLKSIDTAAYKEQGTFASETIEHIKSIIQGGVQKNGDNLTEHDHKPVKMTLDDIVTEFESIQAGRNNANYKGYLVSEDIKGFLSQLRVSEEKFSDINLAKHVAVLSAMGRLKSNSYRLSNNASDAGRKITSVSKPDTFIDELSGNTEKGEFLLLRDGALDSSTKTLSANINASFSREFTSSATSGSGSKSEQTLQFSYQTIKDTSLSYTKSSSVKGGPARNLPFYMLNQVSKQVFRSIQNGEKEILLQLKPPQLGRLKISLETVRDVVRVSIITENQNTHKILKSHAQELKAVLQEQGVRLEKLDVRIDFNFEQSMAQMQQESKGSKERNQTEFRVNDEDIGQDNDRISVSNVNSTSLVNENEGMLDLIV